MSNAAKARATVIKARENYETVRVLLGQREDAWRTADEAAKGVSDTSKASLDLWTVAAYAWVQMKAVGRQMTLCELLLDKAERAYRETLT